MNHNGVSSLLVRSAVRGVIPGLLIFAWSCVSAITAAAVGYEIHLWGMLEGLLAGALVFALVLSPVWRPIRHDRAIAGALTLAAAIGSAFVMIGTAELLAACAIGTMFALAITQITPAEASISHRLVVVGAGLAALAGGAFLPHLVTPAWLDMGWKVSRVLLEAMVACRVALTIAFRTGYRPAPASP
jgi:hypothetical protein